MTSCLLAKAPDRLVVVADGRLSVSDTKISLDSAEKIIRFTPSYRVPQVDRGYFVRYSDRPMDDWCIAYSGNVAIAAEIVRAFTKRVTRGLFLTWSGNKTELAESFDEGAYSGEYLFEHDDEITLTPSILADHLRRIAKAVGDEFAVNRSIFPDCEFLIFGRDGETRDWTAYKVHAVEAGWTPGETASWVLDEIANGQLAAIGSPSVAGAAFADDKLTAGLAGWAVNKSVEGMFDFPEGFDFSVPPLPRAPRRPDPANWTVSEVRDDLIKHIRASEDPGVGGALLVATGQYSHGVQLNNAEA